MGRRKNPNPSVRYRFSIPGADDVVPKWIAKQSNLSSSLHVMIRAFVRQYGFTDAMCVEFGTTQRKVGRPPKNVRMLFESMDMGTMGDEVERVPAIPSATPDVQPKVKPKPVDRKPAKPAAEPEDDGMVLPTAEPESEDGDYRDALTGIFGSSPAAVPGGIMLGMPGDDEE